MSLSDNIKKRPINVQPEVKAYYLEIQMWGFGEKKKKKMNGDKEKLKKLWRQSSFGLLQRRKLAIARDHVVDLQMAKKSAATS